MGARLWCHSVIDLDQSAVVANGIRAFYVQRRGLMPEHDAVQAIVAQSAFELLPRVRSRRPPGLRLENRIRTDEQIITVLLLRNEV